MDSTPPRMTAEKPLKVRPWLAAYALCRREIVRFVRQRNRVFGALGQPLVFWVLFSAGLDRSFQLSPAGAGGQSFRAYYFPGTLVLVLLFTAIFATISIIEDRREGFLQSVLVSPSPRWAMVLGKILGGSLIAMLQALIFCLLALTLSVRIELPALLGLVAFLFLTALALTSLGFVLAWRMESTQGFHAIMNLFLMPMWLLSGSFFPAPSAEGAWLLHWVMRLNPLTYGVQGVRLLLMGGGEHSASLESSALFWVPSLPVCWCVTVAFAVLAYTAAWAIAGQRTAGDRL